MIEIPSSVTFIEKYAFCGCSSLNEIAIPPSITSIENGTFMNCTSLKKVNIQSSLTLIGFKAFDNCKSLIDIKIPYVKKIGFNAFQHCESLKKIEVLTQDIEIMLEFPEHFSIILVGNSYTGKTCILNRFTENIFDENYIETIACDAKSKIISVQGYDIKFNIFDIAGHERYMNLSIDFCRHMKGIIVVFDLTNVESFDIVRRYFDIIINTFDDPAETILLGNKSDLIHEVSDKDISEKVSNYNTKYFEVSAKNDTNLNDAFQYLANKIVDTYLAEKDRLLNLINNAAQNRKKCAIY